MTRPIATNYWREDGAEHVSISYGTAEIYLGTFSNQSEAEIRARIARDIINQLRRHKAQRRAEARERRTECHSKTPIHYVAASAPSPATSRPLRRLRMVPLESIKCP